MKIVTSLHRYIVAGLLMLAAVCTFGQGTPVAPATAADMAAGTSRTKYVSPAALASNTVSVGALKVGIGANQVTIGVSNSVDGSPLVMAWYQTIDYNTNKVDVTNGAALFNQAYDWFALGNCYTNSVQIARNLTNRTDFAATNVFGPNGTNYWAMASSLGGAVVNVTTNFPFGQWYSGTTGAASNVQSFFRTNSGVYKYQGYGAGASNFFTMQASITNGNTMWYTSNGQPFLLTSKIGSTNQARTNFWAPAP